MNDSQGMFHWSLKPFYASLSSPEYLRDKERLVANLAHLKHDVETSPALSKSTMDIWVELLLRLESLEARYTHLYLYTYCRLATGRNDDEVIKEHAWTEGLHGGFMLLESICSAALKPVDTDLYSELRSRPELAGAGRNLEMFRRKAQSTMSAESESLAASLLETSSTAWAQLRGQLANRLEFAMQWPNGSTEPLSVHREVDLMSSPDGRVRDAAATAISQAWESQQDVLAACLDSIAGTRLALCRSRGTRSPLAESLADASISAATLDAFTGAVAASKAAWWRYLALKARLLGREKLAIHDRLALLPLGKSDGYRADEGFEWVTGLFEPVLPDLADFSRMARLTGCIEYATGPGYGGTGHVGFCIFSHALGRPRVYTEYHGSLVDINILAHELGHGYHAYVCRKLRPWQVKYPATLAETASTVAEGIFRQQIIADDEQSADLRLQVLGMQMDACVNYLLRIPRDFEFEHEVYERRKTGQLGARQLRSLMAEAHDRWFGDSLDAKFKDEMHWASRSHFYATHINFYNYPYTFGFLFSASLLRRLLTSGESFRETYRMLLMDTGSMTAEDLAEKHLGEDLTRREFWQEEIDQLAGHLDLFEQLARQRFPEKFSGTLAGDLRGQT